MLTLLVFALLAGALTAVTPCVLPVLPALLSASGTGGRRRPVAIVLGLIVTHFLTIVALASVVRGVGLGDDLARNLAIVVLAVFGIALVWPALAQRVERVLAPLTRLGPRGRGDGFLSGLVVGGALGFAYAPCAGPILAAVISVSATQGASGGVVAVAIAYSIGSAAALLAIALGGRRLLQGRGPALQRASGVVLVATAIVLATGLDIRFQTALANDLPGFVSNPTKALEETDAVEDGLADLRGAPRIRPRAAPASDLPVYGPAPEFTGTGRWFNSQPLTLAGLRGRVVLIDFWTYTCINCIRTFPFVRGLDAAYRDDGLTVVGVHTPEFDFEREAGNVADAIAQNDLRYPVVQDNEYGTWQAWGNQYWPAKYLIDAEGQVRYAHFGEGGEEETEAAVRALLGEAGTDRVVADTETAEPGTQTPETYLGAARAERFLGRTPRAGTGGYPRVGELPPGHFNLSGGWRVDDERATATGRSRIDARFTARRVFLVLASRGNRPRRVRVLIDGRPVLARDAGADVRDGTAIVDEERLYRLVDLGGVQERRLTLELETGISAYAFTFG